LRTAEKPGAASFRYTEIPTSTSAGSRTAVDEGDEDDDGVGGDRFEEDAIMMITNDFQRSARVLQPSVCPSKKVIPALFNFE
jgi:hypothetical protein